MNADRAGAQDWAREMFDHTSHDFGTVARGAKVEHRFGVENIYLEDAHIESAQASCGCTSPEVPAQILKTWKKAYVIAKVDTVNFQGQKDVTIKVKFDKPFRAEVQLYIHCYIRSDVVLDPGSVHLRTAQGSATQQRVSVRYAGRPDWQIQRDRMCQSQHYGQGDRGFAWKRHGELRSDGKPGGRCQGRLLAR